MPPAPESAAAPPPAPTGQTATAALLMRPGQKNEEAVKGSLVERTLVKYRSQLRQLRRQFELLRTRERFVRRQPDGCDFDLDAVIESLSDRRAGLAGSDQLFIRLRRDERDIAALFLVDMSSSTEGWVNQALQETLILTGEALQADYTLHSPFSSSSSGSLRINQKINRPTSTNPKTR